MRKAKVPLRKWFAAIFLFMSNRKGIPSTQLAREIGVTQKTAWFMLCRLRQVADAMRVDVLKDVVEVDECYVGGRNRNRHARKKFPNWVDGFQIVVGAVKRNGSVIAEPIANRDAATLQQFVRRRIKGGSHIHTDEHLGYRGLWRKFRHRRTNHSIGQYVNGDVHTQSIESFWAIVKRAHKGKYHWWSLKHFNRYLREFELRWNTRHQTEGDKIDAMLASVNDTRLSYEDLTK